jgi:hypothetical protein
VTTILQIAVWPHQTLVRFILFSAWQSFSKERSLWGRATVYINKILTDYRTYLVGRLARITNFRTKQFAT